MALLITYETAAQHLRLYDLADDPQVQADTTRQMHQAQALVVKHVKVVPPEWTVDTDPEDDEDFAIVQAAILEVLANLTRFRGDDEPGPQGNGPLTPRVAELLSQLRVPTFG